MTYWMIEHYDYDYAGHRWLRIVLTGSVNGIDRGALDWSTDPQAAMHFSREQDARAFALLHPEWVALCKITSHSDLSTALTGAAKE
jgi:hypothetical protein